MAVLLRDVTVLLSKELLQAESLDIVVLEEQLDTELARLVIVQTGRTQSSRRERAKMRLELPSQGTCDLPGRLSLAQGSGRVVGAVRAAEASELLCDGVEAIVVNDDASLPTLLWEGAAGTLNRLCRRFGLDDGLYLRGTESVDDLRRAVVPVSSCTRRDRSLEPLTLCFIHAGGVRLAKSTMGGPRAVRGVGLAC